MIFSSTLSRYLARGAFTNLLFVLFVLLGIIYLFDTVEILRRASKLGDVGLGTVLSMGLMKMPEAGQLILPFAVLFSAMYTFWQLNRRSELVIIRSAGFSVWQFLAPIMGVAFLTGLLYVVLINPVGSAMLTRFERMENEFLLRKNNAVTLVREGIWLRQPDGDGHIVLHADRIDLSQWVLQDVMVLFLDKGDMFTRRLDAQTARLQGGQWLFEDVVDNAPGRTAVRVPLISLKTDLTTEEIEETFSSPETISFWRLPGYIRNMEETGFDATPLKVHFHALLSQPLMFAAMILLAAAVSMRPPRFRGNLMMVVAGLTIGFIVFFASSFLQALGASHQIPVLPASWSIAVAAFLLGIGVILNLEDG